MGIGNAMRDGSPDRAALAIGNQLVDRVADPLTMIEHGLKITAAARGTDTHLKIFFHLARLPAPREWHSSNAVDRPFAASARNSIPGLPHSQDRQRRSNFPCD
jgi:hypothetical protein